MENIEKRKNQAENTAQPSPGEEHEQGLGFHAQDEKQQHGGGRYLGDVVYGGLDGIITTFAVVSGVAGARLGVGVILILGLANLLADGISMAVGAYLSARSDQEYYEKERESVTQRLEQSPGKARDRLLGVYREDGYTEKEAQELVAITSRRRRRWVETMMVDGRGIMEEVKSPVWSAVATLVSFILAGAVPLLIYLVELVVPLPSGIDFPIASGLSALALFGLGAAKVWVTKRPLLRSGLETLIMGGLAASVAYGVGALLRGIGGGV